jgi:hypothetical protein
MFFEKTLVGIVIGGAKKQFRDNRGLYVFPVKTRKHTVL